MTTDQITLLTSADRVAAKAIIVEIYASAGYQLARHFIQRAALHPRECLKTCSIAYVRQVMASATGYAVTEDQMTQALADEGFVARNIEGIGSTNVRLRGLQRAMREGVELPLSAKWIQPGPSRSC